MFVFNFRCLTNWQKNVNGENFLIYGTELVQKTTLVEIVTQQTVHLASPLYVSQDGGPSYHRHNLFATVFHELLSVVLLAGIEAIAVCSSYITPQACLPFTLLPLPIPS